jgi:uncharacterized protein
MPFPIAQKIIDFLMGEAPVGQEVQFAFFGGEPFLCFDLIRQVVAYLRELERRQERPVRLSVTTNGTLLTRPILDYLRKEEIALCVSIDGPAPVHDRHRTYPNGRGSFEDVLKNLRTAIRELGGVQVNAVYGPDTVDSLPETTSFLAQLGAAGIHLNPDITASWPEAAYAKLRESYMRIAEAYVQSYQEGHEIAVSLIDSKVLLFLKGGYGAEDLCGMGETEWGFAPSGNIYPCERFIGEDGDSRFCLGNVRTGLDAARRCVLIEQRGNHNRECVACEYNKYCMNWCGCTNYYRTGQSNLAGPMLCASERAAIAAAEHAFFTLTEQDNDLFVDHIGQYMNRGRHH